MSNAAEMPLAGEAIQILTITGNRPDRSIVSVVCPQPLSVRRKPSVDDVILGSGEQQVTLLVVDDLGKRTLVTCGKGMHPRINSGKLVHSRSMFPHLAEEWVSAMNQECQMAATQFVQPCTTESSPF